MVTRFRMKVDVLGQGILIIALILLGLLASGVRWPLFTLILLSVWQLVSAIHLLYAYKHIKRLNYLRTAIILGVSLPIWIYLIGNLAYLPIFGILLWYFIQTIRDTIIVYKRPRSFWDIM